MAQSGTGEMLKIDIFNHFMPRPYLEKLSQIVPAHPAVTMFPRLATLCDVNARLRLLDAHPGVQQVLSLANPPLETIAPPDRSPDLAKLANDCLAAICHAHPDRFPAFIAALPMNNVEATLSEIDRAIAMGARGIQLFTNVCGEPLSLPKFRPVFQSMARHDLPVWVHPMRTAQFPDYPSETESQDEIWFSFGWPYETTACMTRLIYSGLLDELPSLKIITHHYGGMIPFFAGKIDLGFRQIFFGTADRNPAAEKLKRRPREYYEMLYADTAVNGEVAAMLCGHAFFKTSHTLFATDAPFDTEGGHRFLSGTMAAIDALPITAGEREAIYAGTARSLMKMA